MSHRFFAFGPLGVAVALAVACTGADGDAASPGVEPYDSSAGTEAGDGDGGAADGEAPAPCQGTCTADQACCDEVCIDTLADPGAPLVSQGPCKTPIYGRYANLPDPGAPDRGAENRLPDFSFAGYRGGGVAIPAVPVRARVSPGPGDDRARIQAAIDQVSARPLDAQGFRGAVLLARGTYEVGSTLTIAESGVVLRGEGQGEGGTRLVATRTAPHSLIVLRGQGSGYGEVPGTRTAIASDFVPVGARSLRIASAQGFSPGDSIVIERRPNQAWIAAIGMGQYGWTPGGYVIGHERTITSVDGATIGFDIPLDDSIDGHYGGGQVYRSKSEGMIERCGVEDLRLDSVYSGPEDEAHAQSAIELVRTRDSWVRRVTGLHFVFALVTIGSGSKFNTVEDAANLEPISTLGGSRRYPFHIGSSSLGNLFQRCYSDEARHAFASSARVPGPNVWLDCVSENARADDGPHHRWSTGQLYDNTKTLRAPGASITSGTLRVHNRASSGTGHGWTGGQILFFNAAADGVTVDTPPGAMNWAIGVVGPRLLSNYSPGEAPGMWESEGTPVPTRSLYLAQLEQRLGPDAVRAVTTPEQRARRIWDRLQAWRGVGRLDEVSADPTCKTGVSKNAVCCAASCGDMCTGNGCGAAPGGASSCCGSAIVDSGRSCENVGPPCVMP
jgi:hypothetical protein